MHVFRGGAVQAPQNFRNEYYLAPLEHLFPCSLEIYVLCTCVLAYLLMFPYKNSFLHRNCRHCFHLVPMFLKNILDISGFSLLADFFFRYSLAFSFSLLLGLGRRASATLAGSSFSIILFHTSFSWHNCGFVSNTEPRQLLIPIILGNYYLLLSTR